MTDAAQVDGAGLVHDEDWFSDLFSTHAAAVHRYFVRRTSVSEADDLTADVLATAWRRRDTVTEGFELPWLYRTAGFVLANHRRRHGAVPFADVAALADDDRGDDPADATAQADLARTALDSLSERDREILMLVAWDGAPRDQLAQLLGTSVGGADAALSRARARLRAAWDAAAA